MKFFHPVFMLVIIGYFFMLRKKAVEALEINPKSPEAGKIKELAAEHKKMGQILTGFILMGLIGGIASVKMFFPGVEPFIRTYGHGFIGLIILSFTITNLFIGKALSKAIKEKNKKGLFNFHTGIFYLVMILSAFSALTGTYILMYGPSSGS